MTKGLVDKYAVTKAEIVFDVLWAIYMLTIITLWVCVS